MPKFWSRNYKDIVTVASVRTDPQSLFVVKLQAEGEEEVKSTSSLQLSHSSGKEMSEVKSLGLDLLFPKKQQEFHVI